MTIGAAAYARLLSDSEGSAVRAALGAGASSIIPADFLARYADSKSLPTPPFLAYRGGVQTGNPREGLRNTFRWWVYDEPTYQYKRINDLILLIMAAYPDEIPLSSWYLVCNGASDERPDSALFQYPCRSLTFTAFTRSLT